MATAELTAPFPYFGGKRRVASMVWAALGNVAHYIEPFFGSGAVLLNRPAFHFADSMPCETVNDLDPFIANVWRGIRFAPDEVARWCDWPVSHIDLNARRRKLLANKDRLREGLTSDDEWHDAKLAGYWVWSASCWIGSGLTSPNARPHVGTSGMGVHALGQIPHLSNDGVGVHALGQRPHLSNGGNEATPLPTDPYNTNIYAWMRRLCERLRYVRVVNGDWSQVCGGNWQTNKGVCGMFFDPPYAVEDRDSDIYSEESLTVAHDVRAWAIERGASKDYRIVIAGYDEHTELLSHGWRMQQWKGLGGYANVSRKKTTQGKENRKRECLYFSPHCVGVSNGMLFD